MAVFNPSVYRGIQEIRYKQAAVVQRVSVWPEFQGKLIKNIETGTASVSIYKPGGGYDVGDDPIVDDATPSVGTNGELYYDIDAGDTGDFALGEGYRAEWLFVDPAPVDPPANPYTRQLKMVTVFDVVRTPLVMHPPIRVDDLKTLHVQVHQQLVQQSGGSSTNLDDYAWAVYLMPAWQRVLDYVRAQGKRPALISPPDTFRGMLLHAAAEAMFRAFSRAPDDIYASLSAQHAELYKEAKASTVLRYAESDTNSHVPERSWNQPQLLVGPDPAGGIYGYGLSRRRY